MNHDLPIRIILESPPAGVDFGVQKGKGNQYETIEKQRSNNNDLSFEFKISVNESQTSLPSFTGPYVQGTLNGRFIYIDIGTCAGQIDSVCLPISKIPGV
jgi:hypothetical protein